MSESCLRMKLNVVGSEKVGKTSLLARFKLGEFPLSPIPKLFEKDCLTSSHYTTTLSETHEDEEIEVELWETLVNPYNDRLRPLHYPHTDVYVLCFSVNDMESLSDITGKWLPELTYWTKNVPILLVATKADLRNTDATEALLSKGDGETLAAKEIKVCKYMECSALSNDGVEEVFNEAFAQGVQHFIMRKRKANKKKKSCYIV